MSVAAAKLRRLEVRMLKLETPNGRPRRRDEKDRDFGLGVNEFCGMGRLHLCGDEIEKYESVRAAIGVPLEP